MRLSIKDVWDRYFGKGDKVTPKDQYKYMINKGVITRTVSILKQYGNIDPSHEGLVYWAGVVNDKELQITTVIFPETDSSEGHVTIRPESNFHVVKCLSENRVVHIGQVHSHPGTWVGHSHGDNQWAAFKREGLISIVVPKYGRNGLLPLKECGIHRFIKGSFARLSNRYLKRHFEIVEGECLEFDLRNKNDYRWMQQHGID